MICLKYFGSSSWAVIPAVLKPSVLDTLDVFETLFEPCLRSIGDRSGNERGWSVELDLLLKAFADDVGEGEPSSSDVWN